MFRQFNLHFQGDLSTTEYIIPIYESLIYNIIIIIIIIIIIFIIIIIIIMYLSWNWATC